MTHNKPMWDQGCSGTALTAKVGGGSEDLQNRPGISLGAPRGGEAAVPVAPGQTPVSCLLSSFMFTASQ